VRLLKNSWILVALLLAPWGCSHDVQNRAPTAGVPHIRVRLLENVDQVAIRAADNPRASVESQPGGRLLQFPPAGSIPLFLTPDGWHIGRLSLGSGVMTLQSASDRGVAINGNLFRGDFRFVPVADGRFDVVNDLDVDDYLKGVVAKEMYASWPIEALRAQAIAARTYALFESHTGGLSRYWDVYPDERSQVYGGMSAETARGIAAVATTAGIVLTYGPGNGHIFKTYFSACCGGVAQSVSDAFPGEDYIEPLGERYDGPCCCMSKYFNWGPIVIKKQELTRRFHIWAQRRGKEEGRQLPEVNLFAVARIDIAANNRYGRPTRVVVSDLRDGVRFNWAAEQMREAVNTDAATGTTLPSSFCKIDSDSIPDSIKFYEGHGAGHGVGLCQWCAQARAAAGQTCQQILVEAYPHAKLIPAY
jgi:stage II sporulation protein D